MSNLDRFRNTDKYPKERHFHRFILAKIGEPTVELTSQEFSEKLMTEEIASFVGDWSASSLISGKSTIVEAFSKNGYIYQVIKNQTQYRKAMQAYNSKTRDLNEQFLQWLVKDQGVENYPNGRKIIDRAWQERKSEGLTAVVEEAEELVDLLVTPEFNELIRAADKIADTYIANRGNPDSEFISCITPGHQGLTPEFLKLVNALEDFLPEEKSDAS